MNSENAIEVRNVRKHFKVYKDKSNTLRERIIRFGSNNYEKREVLKGISFDIKKGEAVGLIGKNGCGKSTTLKMLTKILKPNSGTIESVGRISSLIELGAGFHPDLTGRENIYINASIFGIKAKEVDKKLDEIIRFSELEEYIDNPVRTYSSGMYMRLAFAVAINVDADILLVDEILAVGDNAFQTKCFNKLKTLKDQGLTIVVVSHALGQVERICDRAIWIEDGLIRKEGPSVPICREYLDDMELKRQERVRQEAKQRLEEEKRKLDDPNLSEDERKALQDKRNKKLSCQDICAQCGPDARRSGNGKAVFTKVEVLNNGGKPSLTYKTGDSMTIKIGYKSYDINEKLNFVIGITRSDWTYLYGSEARESIGNFVAGKEEGTIECTINNLPLLAGEYFLDFWIQGEDETEFDCIHSLIDFNIFEDTGKDHGIMALDHTWEEIQ